MKNTSEHSTAKRQAEALERIAKQLEDLMAFLHGTTIEQVETKKKQMKKKNNTHHKVKGKTVPLNEVEVLRAFVEKSTGK